MAQTRENVGVRVRLFMSDSSPSGSDGAKDTDAKHCHIDPKP